MKKRMEEESKRIEQEDRKRMEKEEEKQRALEEWHMSKIRGTGSGAS